MIIQESVKIENENTISIFGVSAMSRVDGPGIRTVVFFQGCPVNCQWCHSPHSKPMCSPLLFYEQACSMCLRCQVACAQNVHIFKSDKHIIYRDLCRQCGKCIDSCPNSSAYRENSVLRLPTKKITPESLFRQLSPHLSLCDGITLSGGEALLQSDTITFLRLCKDKGVQTCVETSGLLESAFYTKSASFVDIWLLGVRVLTDSGFNFYTEKLINNIRLIKSVSKSVIIPVIPLIPGVMNRKDTLKEILSVLDIMDSAELQFNPWNRSYDVYYKAIGIKPEFPMPTDAEIKKCEAEIRAFFKEKGYKSIN